MTLETILELWHRDAALVNSTYEAGTGPQYTAQSYGYTLTSDLYKELNGIRPRWLANASVTDLAGEYLQLIEQNNRELAQALQDERDQQAAEERLRTPATWTLGDLLPALNQLQTI